MFAWIERNLFVIVLCIIGVISIEMILDSTVCLSN